MLPDFLKEFEEGLRKHIRHSVKINAVPLEQPGKLNYHTSKFSGYPYWPQHMEWPMDKKGKPMILLAQINFSEVPGLDKYPSDGIFQVYLSADSWHKMDDYRVFYHQDTTQQYLNDFSFIDPGLFAQSPVMKEHALTFSYQQELGGTEDFRFDFKFREKPYYKFYDGLTEPEQREFETIFYATGHKVGGYAYFTQTDPREFDEKNKDDVLLLQIDTDEHIMFGDSGVAHILINEQDLINKDFSKAYFYWDCC